jgi:4-hydroxy-tetrahydrodipicolinate synthase
MSNLIPFEVKRLCNLYFDGDIQKAAELQTHLIPLCDALRCEVNPIPLKAALSELGFCKNILRAPLTELSRDNRKLLTKIINEL